MSHNRLYMAERRRVFTLLFHCGCCEFHCIWLISNGKIRLYDQQRNTLCTCKQSSCDHHSSPSHPGYFCRSDHEICLLSHQGRHSAVNKITLSRSFYRQAFLQHPSLLPREEHPLSRLID